MNTENFNEIAGTNEKLWPFEYFYHTVFAVASRHYLKTICPWEKPCGDQPFRRGIEFLHWAKIEETPSKVEKVAEK